MMSLRTFGQLAHRDYGILIYLSRSSQEIVRTDMFLHSLEAPVSSRLSVSHGHGSEREFISA